MDWLEAHVDLTKPELWAAGSAMLAVLAVNAAWIVSRLAQGRQRMTRLLRASGVQALAWLIVSLYLLLLPLMAWRYGAISPYLLGLAELDWVQSLGLGGLLTALLVALALFGWLVYRHELPADDATLHTREGHLLRALRSPFDSALAQWHLAFYRAAAIAWLATVPRPAPSPLSPTLASMQSQSLYWGSWLGVLVLLMEGALNPLLWRAVRSPTAHDSAPGKPEAHLRAMAMTIATTALFVLTRNLWLCLACQVIVETAITGWLPLDRSTHTGEPAASLPK